MLGVLRKAGFITIGHSPFKILPSIVALAIRFGKDARRSDLIQSIVGALAPGWPEAALVDVEHAF